MTRREYITGSGATFPFRLRVSGAYVDLASYTIVFNGFGNVTGAISYSLVYDSGTPTVIYVPYTSIVTTDNVVRGAFDITGTSFERSEPLHITVR